MLQGPDPEGRKRPVNVTADPNLVDKAHVLNINMSEVFRSALEAEVRRVLGERWLEENKGAIEEYNRRVNEQDVFGDTVRTF